MYESTKKLLTIFQETHINFQEYESVQEWSRVETIEEDSL